jgi:hypothetical protein
MGSTKTADDSAKWVAFERAVDAVVKSGPHHRAAPKPSPMSLDPQSSGWIEVEILAEPQRRAKWLDQCRSG